MLCSITGCLHFLIAQYFFYQHICCNMMSCIATNTTSSLATHVTVNNNWENKTSLYICRECIVYKIYRQIVTFIAVPMELLTHMLACVVLCFAHYTYVFCSYSCTFISAHCMCHSFIHVISLSYVSVQILQEGDLSATQVKA